MSVRYALVLACGANLLACGGGQSNPCTPQVLSAIEARYAAQALALCHGYPSLAECPEAPALKADRAHEEEAASCR